MYSKKSSLVNLWSCWISTCSWWLPTVSKHWLLLAGWAQHLCWYVSYSGRFWVFCPAGDTRCTDRVKFGMESTKGQISPPSDRCSGEVFGPQNWKFYTISEYKRRRGRIPCAIFTKFSGFVGRSILGWALMVQSCRIRSRGFRGDLTLYSSKFSGSLTAILRRMWKCFGGAKMVPNRTSLTTCRVYCG